MSIKTPIIAALLLIASMALMGFSLIPVFGSGNIQEQRMALGDSQTLTFEGKARVQIMAQSQGQGDQLLMRADSNILGKLVVKQSGSKVKIRPSLWFMLFPSQTIEYELWLQNPQQISLNGQFETQLELEQAPSLRLSLSGNNQVVVTGQSSELSIQASGRSLINALEWQGQDAVLHLSGDQELVFGALDQVTGSSSGRVALWLPRQTDASQLQSSGSLQRRDSGQYLQ